MKITLLALTLLFVASTVLAQDIALPAPQRTGGKPVFEAINQRQSNRNLAETPIDTQTLANLLWAANGFNRDDKRVIPTANNKQDIDVYVILSTGTYQYDAKANKLILKTAGDHRKGAGTQDYVYVAPVNFIYVADRSKDKNTGTGAHVSCGCAAQNVYLACASHDLGATVRTSIDREVLKKILKLGDQQEALVGQTIGKPAVATE